MRTVDIIIILLYLGLMIGIGFYSRSKIENMDDFMLGGRRFKKFALIGTIMATMVGSGMTMGAIGTVYNGGIPSVFWMYMGFAIGLFVFSFVAEKVRNSGMRSMSEIISDRSPKHTRIISALIIIAYATGIVAINIAGLRTLVVAVLGDSINISVPLLTVLAAAVAILYTSLGGFYAVVITDQIQLGIMIVGVFILGPIVALMSTGGLGNIVQSYQAVDINFFNIMPAEFFSWGGFGIFLAYFCAVPGDPTMPQRALAAHDGKVARLSFLWTSGMALYFGLVLVILGGAAFTLLPGIESGDTVLIRFIGAYYPPIISGLTIAGAAAAVMSSFDSFLILATTHISYDLGKTLIPDITEDRIKKMMPIWTIIIGTLGIIVALYITSLFNYLWMLFSLVGASLIPAFVASMFFKEKVTGLALSLSMVTGLLLTGYGYKTWNEAFLVFGDPLTTGLIGATLVLIVISMFTKRSKSVA